MTARVDLRLYADEETTRRESTHIWASCWLFAAHRAELSPSSWLTRTVGGRPLLLAQHGNGAVLAFVNRCPHRGCELVRRDDSPTRIRCPYHGWTFDGRGALRGVPYADGSHRACAGLAAVPHVAVRGGLVFVRFADRGPCVDEHLGAVGELLDDLEGLSPDGPPDCSRYWIGHRVATNWKVVAENVTDGYHPRIVHAAILPTEGEYRDEFTPASPSCVRDLGNGHVHLDHRGSRQRILEWFAGPPADASRYRRSMNVRHGATTAERLMVDGPPSVFIFPNLFVAEFSLLRIEPRETAVTDLYSGCIVVRGGEAVARQALRKTELTLGPAGAVMADDADLFERTQRGVAAGGDTTIDLARGLAAEQVASDGSRSGNITGETGQRAFWHAYERAMGGDDLRGGGPVCT